MKKNFRGLFKRKKTSEQARIMPKGLWFFRESFCDFSVDDAAAQSVSVDCVDQMSESNSAVNRLARRRDVVFVGLVLVRHEANARVLIKSAEFVDCSVAIVIVKGNSHVMKRHHFVV